MSDILKSFWSKLYAWALPAALMLGAYWLLIYPQVKQPAWLDTQAGTVQAAIFVALTATLAFCLNALSTPLYRILEGYLFWPRWLQDIATQRQLTRKRKLQGDSQSRTGWRRNLAVERLVYYPLRDSQVVPTRFGNALRAFETYGKTRFNLDSQTLWYELCAVAPKYLQNELDSARADVDFFVAGFYLSLCFAVVALTEAVGRRMNPQLLLAAALGVAVMLLCHWMMVRVTRNWSLAVQAVVNLGRKKLAASMGLQLPQTLIDERIMWGGLTKYVFYGEPETGIQLNIFRAAPPGPDDDVKQADDKDEDD